MAYTKADKERNSLPVVSKGPTAINTIDAVNLAQNLSKAINQPAPRTWIGRWFQTRRIDLDGQRIDFLCAYIEKIKQVNQMATQVQAELTVAPQILEYIIQGNVLRAQQEIELQVKSHQNEIARLDDEIQARNIQLDKARVEVDKGKAEVEKMRASNQLILAALNDPDPIRALLAIKAMNPEADAQVASIMDELFKGKIEKEKAEVAKLWAEEKKLKAEARKTEAQADLERHGVDKEIGEDADSE